jgi:hypothetical protein
MKVGDIHKWDYQADVFRGEYRLIEDLGKGSWIIEYVEPSDELIDEAYAYYFGPGAYLGYHDPFGPERREATPQEAFDEEIINRIDRAGQRMTIQFVSSDRYHAMF